MRAALKALLAVAALGVLAGCSILVPTTTTTSSSGSTSTSTSRPSGSATSAPDPIAGLTLEQKVGQLFMIGTPADHLADTAYQAIAQRDVGGVFLSGRSQLGVVATAKVTRAIAAASTGTIPMFIATDQEGGEVQVLSGQGFSTIPTALDQGKLLPSLLQTDAQQWGSELAQAGVNLDLAPVGDIVLSASSDNEPIAQLKREYGFSAADVDPHVSAFVAGLSAARVQTTLKHFPGLGYVQGNTDTESGVTDTVISPSGPTVASFASLMASSTNPGGAPVVMVSSAIYQRIDPKTPAVFSSKVVSGLLRTTIGFPGIVISDDLSAATQVTGYKPGDRAILAIQAGVDIVLVSRTPSVAAGMMDAVLAKAKTDPAFAAKVDAAARIVVAQKAALGITNG